MLVVNIVTNGGHLGRNEMVHLVNRHTVCISNLLQIDSKFDHQVTSLALLGSKVGLQVVSLALPNSLGLPYWHYQLVLSWYLHQIS